MKKMQKIEVFPTVNYLEKAFGACEIPLPNESRLRKFFLNETPRAFGRLIWKALRQLIQEIAPLRAEREWPLQYLKHTKMLITIHEFRLDFQVLVNRPLISERSRQTAGCLYVLAHANALKKIVTAQRNIFNAIDP